ncbi:hypothetical protein [Streptosporangium roseum]|uniref:hypothetical protein n=1 Tax=Streptosporangium roseum TaxID=2001 RepID=UPI0001A3EF3C
MLQVGEPAGLEWDRGQGTNLHHTLLIAGRHLDRRPDFEPTAHLERDGGYVFRWPPSAETLEFTLVEVDKMTRRRDDQPQLVLFLEALAFWPSQFQMNELHHMHLPFPYL